MTKQLVDVWAEWCGPCRFMEPVLHALEEGFDVTIEKVNADENSDFLNKYGILGLPTLLLMDGEKELDRIVGYKSIKQVVQQFSLEPKEE